MTVAVYRIVKARWLASAFDGDAAKIFPGRWNSRGIPMVYTAGSRALALLETLAHYRAEDLVREHFQIVEVILSKECIDKKRRRLPKDWQTFPAPVSTRKIGDRWVSQNISLAMAVPSVIVPREYNYLLNPRHPDFSKVVFMRPERVAIDSRLKS